MATGNARAKRLKIDMDMCSRPLFGKIVRFSLPLIFTGILQLLYNAADIIVVGQFAGQQAMAAVGSTGALVNLLTNLFIGLSVGALAATARWIGAKNAERVDKVVHTSILISLIGGVLIGIIGFFAAKGLLVLMSTPDTVIDLSALYLKIFFVGMPFNLLYNFGAAILRAAGDTKRPLIYLSFAGIVNVILNLVTVICFNMSVAGVALATIISQAISAVLVIRCLIKRKGYGKLNLKKLKIDGRALKEIVLIGLPAGIQSTIFSLSNVIIQSSINSMGDVVMAGNAAAGNLEGFIYISMNAVSQACLTFTGQNYGAAKHKNINLVLVQSMLFVAGLGIFMGGAFYIFGAPLLRIYAPDSTAAVNFGLERLGIVALTYFLCGIMEVIVGSLRGIGHSLLPMLVSIAGVCGVRLIWIFTVFNTFRNAELLYMSYPVSWAFTVAAHLVCFLFIRKKAFAKMSATKQSADLELSINEIFPNEIAYDKIVEAQIIENLAIENVQSQINAPPIISETLENDENLDKKL